MLARIQGWLAGLGVALVAVGAAWLKGRSAGTSAARARDDEAYRETVERVKDADLSSGSDADDRDWLRKRGK